VSSRAPTFPCSPSFHITLPYNRSASTITVHVTDHLRVIQITLASSHTLPQSYSFIPLLYLRQKVNTLNNAGIPGHNRDQLHSSLDLLYTFALLELCSVSTAWKVLCINLPHLSFLPTKSCSFVFYHIVVLGVHCDIYKSSYNISYLNSLPPSFSFSPPPLKTNRDFESYNVSRALTNNNRTNETGKFKRSHISSTACLLSFHLW
jgi:hypothetical protein